MEPPAVGPKDHFAESATICSCDSKRNRLKQLVKIQLNLVFKLLRQELNTGASLKAHKIRLEKTGACPEAHKSKLGKHRNLPGSTRIQAWKREEPARKHTRSLCFWYLKAELK
jgi:hypothetical protein